MKQLWTEKYRPTTVDEYVFRDDRQKSQVLQWITDKTIPHLMFSGSQGLGKCLGYNEKIDVMIDDEQLSDRQQLDFIDYKVDNYYSIPIGKLFKILNIGEVEYDFPVSTFASVSIRSPYGFVPVNAFVKKRHSVSCYTFENGESITCSTAHLVFENGVATKIDDCTFVDFIGRSSRIISDQPKGIQDVFDVALDDPHQYITPNGIIHHNTTLAKILINELNVDPYDVLEINASRTNSVDDVRDSITKFVQMIPFGAFRVVLLDECLDENTLVHVLRPSVPNDINGAYEKRYIPIKDLDDMSDLVVSYNESTKCDEFKSFTLFDKGVQETLAITFENNQTVYCTPDHKWYVLDGELKVVKASELTDHIFSSNGILGIRSIIEGGMRHVYDLAVQDNHNFYITNKAILTHNCDYLSHNAQAALRGVMEEYADISRFILTLNYKQKIIPALHSRCQGFDIVKIDQTEFTARAATILINESVQFDLDVLDNYVKATYPDLRKCINLLQMNSNKGVLSAMASADTGIDDWKFKMVELFKKGDIKQARKLLCGNITAEETEDVFRWLYDNVAIFGDEDAQDAAILIIKQGLVDHATMADHEINLSGTLIQLARI